VSIAKITTVQRSRKAQGNCGKCRKPINVGDPYKWFKVGFRSRFKHVRCLDPACHPRYSELESSRLSELYAAQEDAEYRIEGAESIDEINEAISDLQDAIEALADEYEQASENEDGVVFNTTAAEYAEVLQSNDLQPVEEDTDLGEAKEEAQQIINDIETP
jgi:hypothetical protein